MSKLRPEKLLPLERGWFRFLLALTVVTLLHLPLYFLELPARAKVVVREGSFPPVVNLSPIVKATADADATPFLAELARWAAIADPRLSVLPNLKNGFSRYANPAVLYPQPELPQWTLPFNFWPAQNFQSSEIAVQGVPLAEMIWQEWNKKTSVARPTKQEVVLPQGDYWTLVGVGPLRQKPVLRPANWYAEAGYQAEQPNVQQATILEVGVLPPPEPQWKSVAPRLMPRILVRQSSGSQKLDALATQAVYDFIREQKSQSLALPGSDSGANNWLLKIDWRFPQLAAATEPDEKTSAVKTQ